MSKSMKCEVYYARLSGEMELDNGLCDDCMHDAMDEQDIADAMGEL